MTARPVRRGWMLGIMFVATYGIAGSGCAKPNPHDVGIEEAPLATADLDSPDNENDGAMPTGPFATVRLTADLSHLSYGEREMLPWLIVAADQMDRAFWLESYGDKEQLLASIEDADTRRLVEVNYGPWNRLGDNQPLIPGVGEKPLGAQFYPPDMTREEFEAHIEAHPDDAEAFKSQYTVIRRDKAGALIAVPYHVFFDEQMKLAAEVLRQAAGVADNPVFKAYLRLRASALLTSDFRESDFAWMEVKDSGLDLVIGPIEHYEDAMFGYKAAHEAVVLVKDRRASERLARFVQMLPGLQRGLPVAEEYKREMPGLDSDLGVYDVVYCTGDANTAKAIGINLPNDEQVQLEKGARRLQLRNVSRAKYDNILRPIAELLIAEDQRGHVQFEAFFEHVLFHEVAHGLGIKHTINGKGLVRGALQDQFDVIEEAKADMLGLYILAELRRQGHITSGATLDNYVTYVADMSRLMRWGVMDAYGQMTMMIFGFMQERGAILRDAATGTYRVDAEKMERSVEELCGKILAIEGDGDYEGAKALIARYGTMNNELKKDIARIQRAGVPIDLIFEQGPEVLGIPRAG